MNIEIKKNLIIFHKVQEFEELFHRLFEEYGRSTMMISWKMKRELGFTIRHHQGLAKHTDREEGWLEDEFRHKYHYEQQIHLDFFDEAQQSFFILKYLNNV